MIARIFFRLSAAVVVAALVSPVVVQAADEPTPVRPQPYYGHFETEVLAGGTVNTLVLPFKENLLPPLDDAAKIAWERPPAWAERNSLCDPFRLPAKPEPQESAPSKGAPAGSAAPKKPELGPTETLNPGFRRGDTDKTVVGLQIPAPPCWLPMRQRAKITIAATIDQKDAKGQPVGPQKLFDEEVEVTVFWLPLLITLLVLAVIYPGCALMYGYMRQRNYERELAQTPVHDEDDLEKPPSLLASMDPVQLTANPWGRAALGKLQIFVFTLIVFGLLLFYQLRSSVLAAMSTDVMLLMGISAFGAAGGKIAYRANRRLSFDNFAWLIRQGWLPDVPHKRDVASRAKWSELFLDSQTKEFDPYSFQMAVFSIVVAVALVQTSLSGLGTFKIPPELLALLGISHTVFIGGKALDQGGYTELDDKLNEVRKSELNLVALTHKADAKPDDVEKEKKALQENIAQAAQMFIECYRNQLQVKMPDIVEKAARSDPAAYKFPDRPTGNQ
jgi:hypothetical protein